MNRDRVLLWSILGVFGLTSLLLIGFRMAQEVPGTKENNQHLLSKSGVGLIQIYGPISVGAGNAFNPNAGSDGFIDDLQSFEKDNRIKVLLLRINSPGGTVGASQELYQAIVNYKKKTGVPVVVSIADMGTSGAYWTAMAADYIFANPGSLVGNIGVIMDTYELSQLAQKWGVGHTTIKSGEFKDAMSMWRKPSERELNLLQTLVDNVHHQFVAVVQQSRKLTPDKAKALTDGRVFTGEQAKATGLIDEVGSYQDALAYAKKIAKLDPNAEVITHSKNSVYQMLNMWRNESRASVTPLSLLQWMGDGTSQTQAVH